MVLLDHHNIVNIVKTIFVKETNNTNIIFGFKCLEVIYFHDFYDIKYLCSTSNLYL